MDIQWIGSPNFTNGREGKPIKEVILHWMAGNMASADATFQNRSRNTSAHFGVEDYKIHQYVDVNNTAYQAGNWEVNQTSVGIEHSAQPGRDATDATYETSAQLIAKLIKENNVGKSFRPHRAVVATACPGTLDVDRIIRRVNEILGGDYVAPAPSKPPKEEPKTATVIVGQLNVRSQPTSKSPQAGSMVLNEGDTFQYTEIVKGELVRGVSTWVKSTRGNYVWAGGLDVATTPAVQEATGGTAQAIRDANVRTQPNTNGGLVKQPDGNTWLSPGQTFQYSAKVYGQTVTQNGVTSNVWYHSLKGNYVWGGNLKDV